MKEKIKSRKLNYCVIQKLRLFSFSREKNKFEHFPSFGKCQFSSNATPFHFAQWNIKKKNTEHRTGDSDDFVDEWREKIRTHIHTRFISDLIQSLHDTLQPNSKVFLSALWTILSIHIGHQKPSTIRHSPFHIDVQTKKHLY